MPKTTPKPTFGYFLNEDERQLWWCGPNYPEHTADEEQKVKSWPIVTMFEFADDNDGDGWGRGAVQKYAKVLDAYCHNVGPGHENWAVLLEIPSVEAYRQLCRLGDQLEEVPAPL